MKINRIIAVSTALVMMTAFVSCGNKKGEELTDPVTIADEGGPSLYLSNTEAERGGVAEITLSVKGADMMWNMCGIHVTYPDMLKCQMVNEEERTVKYKKGSASEYATASVGMLWRDGLPEELTEKNQGTVFFTELFDGNSGLDGDIVTFYFDVPEDAEKGTYPVGFYVMDSDMFADADRNTAFQTYTFSHLQEGTITIK